MDIFEKIDAKSVTAADFNDLISESLPDLVGFNSDRIRRKVNPTRGIVSGPAGISPKSSITPKRSSEGINVSPAATPDGRRALEAAGKREKRKALTPVEWVQENSGKKMSEYLAALHGTDQQALAEYVDERLANGGDAWLERLRVVLRG